jgi:hypothetical protein
VIACYLKYIDWCKERLDECDWAPSFLRRYLRLPRIWVNYHWRHLESYSAFTNRLLITLCDIQIVTGLAILIAGLPQLQLQTISFYHEQLISNFWNQTVNSYWAARDSSFDRQAGRVRRQFQVRIGAIWISIILATVFQWKIFTREKSQWDENRSGFCYRSHDSSTDGVPLLWIIGLVIYAIYLFLYLWSSTNDWMEDYLIGANRMVKELETRCSDISERLGPKLRMLSPVADLLAAFLGCSCATLWYLLKRFLSFYCLGDRRHILEVLAFIGMSCWNTFDIIDLKVSNHELLEGSENGWGFGQILSIGLLGIIVLTIFDSYTGKR